MENYIDGFVLPVPRIHLSEYKGVAPCLPAGGRSTHRDSKAMARAKPHALPIMQIVKNSTQIISTI